MIKKSLQTVRKKSTCLRFRLDQRRTFQVSPMMEDFQWHELQCEEILAGRQTIFGGLNHLPGSKSKLRKKKERERERKDALASFRNLGN